MAKIDLKDAYFLIKTHDDYKKYLRFQWGEQIYEFNVLPFGLSTAPYVFTKLMKPVAKLLRSAGFMSTVYLDDWFLVAQSFVRSLLRKYNVYEKITYSSWLHRK